MWQVQQFIKGVWACQFFWVIMPHSGCQNVTLWLQSMIVFQLIFRISWSSSWMYYAICIQLPLAPGMWQWCKAFWTSWPNPVSPWLWSQLVAAGWHISRLLFFHIQVIYLSGNVTKKALIDSHFHLLSLPPFFLSSFFLPILYIFLPHCTYRFLSLITPSCVKLTVSCSPGNRLTFALGYYSNLLVLKYMDRQNPTLHFRHGKISATVTSPLSHQHMAVYWSVFMNVLCTMQVLEKAFTTLDVHCFAQCT